MTETMPAAPPRHADPSAPAPVHGPRTEASGTPITATQPCDDVFVPLVVSARMSNFDNHDAVRNAVLEWVRLSTSMVVGNLSAARLDTTHPGVAQRADG